MEELEIRDMKFLPCVKSRFVVPGRVTYTQNGFPKQLDYVKVHDSVSILIYNKTRDAFVLVKQFRPAPFLNSNLKMSNKKVSESQDKTGEKELNVVAPFDQGVTYELCAGIVDQSRSLVEIAQSEIEEETGYIVPLEKIEKIFQHTDTVRSGNVGAAFYAEVTDDMKTAKGGGCQDSGEFIELYYLPRSQAKDFALNEKFVKPSSFIAVILWYFTVKNQ